ncbi:hypothetical protein NBO_63g0013 [Nosema bombycis CQ1]|uniref:Uncharacterized protein n=1 Tax=Nosema bombycis (strain CQ1 / CVCC 102059) TaxID=578461 RepID=R0M6R2_NOSB1|nr:hypothetical protein NBO_63g0013 [Nosema bombycis CQ1]|eukprot:EOB13694.1 hypothetical protein NBO_63g0013 [Nosema bombycis CQ1]
MPFDKKNTSTIKIKPPLERFVEKGQIIECLICHDIFYPSKYKSHPCCKKRSSQHRFKLEEHEKDIFDDPIKLEKLLDLKPVVNFIWKYPNYQTKQIQKDKKREKPKK